MSSPFKWLSPVVRTLSSAPRRRVRSHERRLAIAPLEPRLVLSTTTAVQSGDWHDPAVWDNGVPDDQTRAIVSQGTTVNLAEADHVAKELVVHGTLNAVEGPALAPSDPTVVASDRVRLYVDGQASGVTEGSQLWAHAGPVGVGAPSGSFLTHLGSQTIRAGGLRGAIDSVTVFNRALTQAEIDQIATVERAGAEQLSNNDAVAAWDFTTPPLPGDYNRDATVDAADWELWRTTFGSSIISGTGADATGDGIVNAADYTVWRDNESATADLSAATQDAAPNDAIDDNGFLVGQSAIIDSALMLDGVADRFQIESSTELTDAVFEEKTVSFWFKPEEVSGLQVLYEQGDVSRGMSIYIQDGTLYAGGWNTPVDESGWQGDWATLGGVTAGQWRHVALTLDADTPVTTRNKTLTADWVHVNSGGVLQVGTAIDRYDSGIFKLTLTGDNSRADHTIETAMGQITVTDNDAFLMTGGGGRLQLFGDEKLSFTKLAVTAETGAQSIVVENVIERNFDGVTSDSSDGRLDWRVGDRIVIASSSYDYEDEEVRTITGLQNLRDGTTRLTLDQPFAERHFGEVETYSNGQRTWDIDLRAEVALLNRTIVVQGDEGSDTDTAFGNRALWNGSSNNGVADGVGGHVMIMPGSGQITLDSVNFDRLGQAGTLGRYPVHWHLTGNRTGDVLRGSSVTNSNNRGVTVHGAQNILLENNVLHDIHGHGFFMEDAAETGNTFRANIALGIHKVGGSPGQAANDPFVIPGVTRDGAGQVNGTAARGGNGESSHDSGQQVSDRFIHSAAYWITNPDNTWVGNVSAGAEGTGFWFALPDSVLALSKDTGLYDDLVPNSTNLRQFDHNTSHSSPVGLTFDRGADIDPGSNNHYAPPQPMQINHLTAYKHDGTAVYHRASVGVFNESRFADNATSSFNTFRQDERNILFVGHSRGNADPSQQVAGYRLYDGSGEIDGAHFAGFAASNAYTFNITGGANKHSMTSSRNVSFEDDGSADNVRIDWRSKASLSDDQSPGFIAGRPDSISGLIHDLDGTLTGHLGGSPGDVLTPRLDYYRDSTDIALAGFDGYISDDRYGQLKVSISSGTLPDFEVANGDGHAMLMNRLNLTDIQRMYVKVNAGDYTIDWVNGIPASGFRLFLQVQQGSQPGDSTVFRLPGVGATMKPTSGQEVASLATVRSAGSNSYFRDPSGDLWWKIFQSSATRDVQPTNDLPLTSQQSSNGSSNLVLTDGVTPFSGADAVGGASLTTVVFPIWPVETLSHHRLPTAARPLVQPIVSSTPSNQFLLLRDTALISEDLIDEVESDFELGRGDEEHGSDDSHHDAFATL